MVAIRPERQHGQAGQKFVVSKRFESDGYKFKIGDVIVAKEHWVHKIPMLIDQRFISPYLSEAEGSKTPANLTAAELEQYNALQSDVSDEEVGSETAKVVAPVVVQPETPRRGRPPKAKEVVVESSSEDEIDDLVNQLA